MRFVVAIEPGSEDQAFGVIVPDLPGCFSAGDTFKEALMNSRKAILMHLEQLAIHGVEVFDPESVDIHAGNHEYNGWVLGFIDVHDHLLGDKVGRPGPSDWQIPTSKSK